MAERNYESMSIEELEVEQQLLDQERKGLKAEMMKIVAILDRRQVEAEAQRKYEGMSAAEKAALHQMIAANGVESGEDVGKPGA